jgi:hypothetical protein
MFDFRGPAVAQPGPRIMHGYVRERISLPAGPVAQFDKGFGRGGTGSFRLEWEAMGLPGPGAQNYAFAAFGLVPFQVTGRGFGCGQPPRSCGPTQQALPATKLVGVPTIAGGMYTAPLSRPPIAR